MEFSGGIVCQRQRGDSLTCPLIRSMMHAYGHVLVHTRNDYDNEYERIRRHTLSLRRCMSCDERRYEHSYLLSLSLSLSHTHTHTHLHFPKSKAKYRSCFTTNINNYYIYEGSLDNDCALSITDGARLHEKQQHRQTKSVDDAELSSHIRKRRNCILELISRV